MGFLPPNDVGGIAQYVREGEGRKGSKNEGEGREWERRKLTDGRKKVKAKAIGRYIAARVFL